MTVEVLAAGLKVLLIDDSPEDRRVLKGLLTQDPLFSYEFEETGRGNRALEICLSDTPDLIFLGYRLRDISGLEFLEHLANLGRELTCPIIVLAGLDNQDSATRFKKYNIQGYLVKDNLTPQRLHQAVHLSFPDYQRRLQERYNLHKQILESNSDGFYAIDRQERFTYVNTKIEELWGMKREELFGKRFLEVFPWIETTPIYTFIDQALKKQRAFRFETYLPVSQIWAMVSAYPTGEGLVVYYQDLTERKEAEDQRLRWQEELEKQVQERTAELAAEIEERRRVEEELRQSRELYRGVLNAMSEGVVVQDPEGRVIATNPTAEKILGRPTPDIIGRVSLDTAWQTVYEDGTPCPGEGHPAMITLRTGQPCLGVRLGLTRPDSSLRWLLINSEPLFQPDEAGLRGVVVTFSDITQSIAAEQALRESEEQYRLLAENSLDMVFKNNPDGKISYISPACRMILGFEPQELAGTVVSAYIHPDDLPRVNKIIQNNPSYTDPLRVDFRARRKDGEYIWLETISKGVTDLLSGAPVFSTGVIRDITTQKRAEEALRESEEQYRLLFDNNFYGVLLARPDGKIAGANPAICRMLGYERPEISALTHNDLVDLNTATIPFDKARLRREKSIQWEAEFIHKNGTRITALAATSLYLDRNGQEQLCIMVQDIREQRRMEEALRASEERFRVAQENSPDRFTILKRVHDEAGQVVAFEVVYANPVAVKDTGLSPEELIGKRYFWEELNRQQPGTFELANRVVESGEPFRVDYFQPANGLNLWFQVSAVKLGDGLAVTSRDITTEKLALQSLKESEEWFRLLAENSPDLVYKLDPNGKFSYISPACRRLLGFEPQELTGQDAFSYCHPEDLERVSQLLYRYQAGPEVELVEFRYRHRDGHYIWFQVNGYRTEDETTGEILYFIGSARDIGTQKAAEEELRRREQEFRALVENSPDLVLRTDLNLRVLYVNPAFSTFTGVAAERLIGKIASSVRQHRADGIVKALLELKDRLLQTGLPQSVEYENVTAHGTSTYFQYRMVPELNAGGQVESLLIIARDLTELKKAQDEVLGQERFRTLFELSPDGVALSDPAGKLISCNQALEELTGYPREKIIGQYVSDLGLIDREQLEQIIEQALKNHDRPGPLIREIVINRSDGGEVTIEVKLQTVLYKEQIHFISTIRDISGRKRLEEGLRQALAQQQELSEIKNRFIATISHEFRTPLSVIQAAGESLDKYIDRMTTEQIHERVGKIKVQIRHITRLLDDILTYNRLQTNPQDYLPLPGDLVEFSRNLLAELVELDQNRHPLLLLLPQAPLEISFDRQLVKQVIGNLISNALKYSPDGTKVEFELRQENEEIVIRVTDRGIGIPEKDQRTVFEAFYRAENAGTIQGTGMGLAILKEALNQVGGEVSFTSLEGEGTTFIVTLPIR